MLEGVPASPGIVMGKCLLFQEPIWHPEPRVIDDGTHAQEIQCFRQAIEKTLTYLKNSYAKTREQFGEELAEIIEMQIALLEDDIFLKEVEDLIEQKGYSAAYATFVVFRQKKEYFLKLPNEYFRDRALDIYHLKKLIILNILGKEDAAFIEMDSPAIVVADTLSPQDTVQLHRLKVLGFATNTGGKMSHTAIVARSLGVPAVVGLSNITDLISSGNILVLDGNSGKVVVNPGKATIEKYKKKRSSYLSREEKLLKESAWETSTKCGKRIWLRANIEFEDEVPNIQKVGADGVGLFRTEGLFLNRQDLPSEDEQAEIYDRIAQKLYPQPVVIRTLDIGGDKVAPDFIKTAEDNPFLGWRAIRFWLDHEAGFLQQLKAILRANTRGNVQILLPMVSGLDEIRQVKALLKKAAKTLKREKKPFGANIKLGIMVEIPSVVVLADLMAREVDFFSIGTNDLVQYTLAVDRGNERVARLYSHFHPAVLRMIKLTIDAARAANIPVAMCGEMAGDRLAIPLLLAMGLEEFSATPTSIPGIKKIIREIRLEECREFCDKVCKLPTTQEITRAVHTFFRERFPDLADPNGMA